MDKRRVLFRKILKYTAFSAIVFVLYVLQSIPGFLSFFDIKPVFIVPFCVALSISDESGWIGIVIILGGLLTDMSANRVVGYFTIPLIILCTLCVIAVKFFLKATRQNAFFISFTVMFILLTFDFIFSYALHGYSHGFGLFFKNAILLNAYSSLFCPIFYKLIDSITYSRIMQVEAR